MGARPDDYDYDVARSYELERSLDRDEERERSFLRRDFRRRMTRVDAAPIATVDTIHAPTTNEEP